MTPEAARHFRLKFQKARENALKDAEAFDGIIHVIERLGIFCLGCEKNLGGYKDAIEEVVKLSPLAGDIPAQYRNVHAPFSLLYDMVLGARNDALHIGAFARHLTTHAIELAPYPKAASRCWRPWGVKSKLDLGKIVALDRLLTH
jgi:hypothetical protein